MRFGSRRTRSLATLATLLVVPLATTACGGTDPAVPTTITITSGPIDLTTLGGTATVTAEVRDQNGEELPNAELTFSSENPSVATVSSTGVVTATGYGSSDVTVSSGSASADVTASVTRTSLQAGVPITGLGGAQGDRRVFTFTVPSGSTPIVLEVLTGGGTGDMDLAVNFGSDPTGQDFDCDSFTSSNSEFCVIPEPQAGEWRIAIDGAAGFSGAALRATTRALPTAPDGTPVTDVASQVDVFRYFAFDVPAATAAPGLSAGPTRDLYAGKIDAGAGLLELTGALDPVRSPGSGALAPMHSGGPEGTSHVPTLSATTTGGIGDVDLAGAATPFISNTSPVACLSVNDANEESCLIENPEVGRWTFLLLPFTAYSGVTFEVDYTPIGGGGDPTQGTITIQKEIQSSTGGAPDNPANPSLAGFVFEVRPAGGGAVVATATSDAAGVARVSLDPGSYDVTESNSQGLTDVTGAVNAVSVTQGTDAGVTWINRQAENTGGNTPPVAAIEGAPGAVPFGDNNQTEVRLYGGNSTDADGDVLTYSWSASGGTFIGSTTGQFARVTFPGGSAQTISLTVSDGEDQNTAQFQVAGGGSLPAAGTFDIELVNADGSNPSAAVQNAFDLAEAALERIVVGDASNFSLDNISPTLRDFLEGTDEGDCDIGTTASGTVDDLRIYVDISPIDGPGQVLGQAGPCLFRSSQGPEAVQVIVGRMQFDSDDLGNFSAERLNRLILHEMLHVLGLGTLWPTVGLLENPSCSGGNCTSNSPSPDTRFTGVEGARAYRALGGVAMADVPVENGEGNSAGPGNRDGHWREAVFNTELMTGFLDNNTTNPLSIITIQSLIDLGYTVNAAEADNYSIPGSAPFPTEGDEGALDLHGDIRLGAIWGVNEAGEVVRVVPGR